MQKLVIDACKNDPLIKLLLVTDITRLGREFGEVIVFRERLKSLGVELKTLNEGHADMTLRLMADMQANFAKIDSNIRSQRTRTGLRQNARKGYSNHQPKEGYVKGDVPGIHKPAIDSFSVLRIAFISFMNGESLQNVVSWLEKVGYRSHKGKHLVRSQFKRMLRDVYYMGLISYAGEISEGLHKPLISKAEYEKIQERLLEEE